MNIFSIISSPKRLINYISIFVVFLNFTNTYLVISGITNLSFQHVSLFMMSILSFNTLLNINLLKRIVLRQKLFVIYLIAFCLIPAVGVFFSPFVMVRFFGYYILSGLIFLNVIIFIKKEGFTLFKKYIFYSYLVALGGLVVSYLIPGLFASIANMQAATLGTFGVWGEVEVGQASHARAFGFYMQSNVAYTALLFHLYILLTTYFNRSFKGRLFLYISSFAAILITGSRGGFVMFFILVFLMLFSEFRNGCRNKSNNRVSFFSFIPGYIAAFMILLIAALGLTIFGKKAILGDGINAVQKISETFLSKASGGVSQDVSVIYRINAQAAYIGFMTSNPFRFAIGYGPGASDYYKYFGDLPNSSHNNYLEVAFKHGIFIALLMYGMLIFLALSKASKKFFFYHGYNISAIITICMLIQSFTINTLFNFRLFPVLMAFWLMSLYFPVYEDIKN